MCTKPMHNRFLCTHGARDKAQCRYSAEGVIGGRGVKGGNHARYMRQPRAREYLLPCRSQTSIVKTSSILMVSLLPITSKKHNMFVRTRYFLSTKSSVSAQHSLPGFKINYIFKE